MEHDIHPELATREKVSIADIHVEPEMQGARAMAWVYVEVDNHTREEQQVVAAIVVKLGDIQEKIEVVESIEPEGGIIEAVIRIEEPELWWPHGFGEQTLYTCMAGLVVEGEVQDVDERRFGIREIQMLDREGERLLLVNGEEIACDASVWAPEDQFVEAASSERYQKLVQEAKDAGAVMIRAWGEGSEEDTPFYSACDEQGMLVWQELAADVASAPSDEFAEVVAEYIGERVKNLRNHPSIAVWCGSADPQLEPGTEKLLEVIIPRSVAELDRTRPYVTHCPRVFSE